MSKKEQTVKEETAKVVEEMSDGKTTEELQSIAQTLQTQLISNLFQYFPLLLLTFLI